MWERRGWAAYEGLVPCAPAHKKAGKTATTRTTTDMVDMDLLRTTAVTRGWNGYRNKSQRRNLTLEKKILPIFEPATFRYCGWRDRLVADAFGDVFVPAGFTDISYKVSHRRSWKLKFSSSWPETRQCTHNNLPFQRLWGTVLQRQCPENRLWR